MAVAHDASSESHTGTTGSVSEASFSWTHTPVGTPRGVVVHVASILSIPEDTSVTYGGVTMDLQDDEWFAADTAGEPCAVRTYFLGESIPTGAQTVQVNRNNTATQMYAVAATVTASTDTQPFGVVITGRSGNAAFTELNVSDGTSISDSQRYAFMYTGTAAPPTAGANSTALQDIDFGAFAIAFVRETTAGQGSRPVGGTAGSDDNAGVFYAIREITGVNHDQRSESHTGTTGSTSEASFSWTHKGGRRPGVVVVHVLTLAASANETSVTYGGTSMTSVGLSATDAAGEPATVTTYILDSSIPTGDQTVVVNRTNNATVMYAVAITMLTSGKAEIYTTGAVTTTGDGSLTQQSPDDGSVGTDSQRYAFYAWGSNTNPSTPAGTIRMDGINFGTFSAHIYREQYPGTGARAVGGTDIGTDDRALVYYAVRLNQTAFTALYAQAQADIKATGYLFGQTQADIKAVGFLFAQAQGDIKQTYFLHAQSQADIKQVGYLAAQAQADIKATGYLFAQAQADIKARGFLFGQANADIKAQGFLFGQAQARIGQIYYLHAQAQGDIKAVGYLFGQAQGDIKARGFLFAQAQADIKQLGYLFAQCQALITKTAYLFGQAQGDIKKTSYLHGQAQGDIKKVGYLHGQAQGEIAVSFTILYGQAQGYIHRDEEIQPPGSIVAAKYNVKYNNFILPGYLQQETVDPGERIGNHQAPYADMSLSEALGLENKEIDIRMRVWECDYATVKQTIQRAATYLRSSRDEFAPLEIQYIDRYYDALVTKISSFAIAGASLRLREYTAQFMCMPWLTSYSGYTVTGTGLVTTDQVGRTIADGFWTPTTIVVTGTNVTISGYTDTEQTGYISIAGSVTDMEIDSETYTVTEGGQNAIEKMQWADFAMYVGPGKTYFNVTGASSCTFTYKNRWPI